MIGHDYKNIELHVAHSPESFNVKLYVYSRMGDTMTFFFTDEEGNTVGKDFKRGDDGYLDLHKVTPLVNADEDFVFGVAKAFMKYANSKGLPNDAESFTKGELLATKKHLNDLQELVFKGRQK